MKRRREMNERRADGEERREIKRAGRRKKKNRVPFVVAQPLSGLHPVETGWLARPDAEAHCFIAIRTIKYITYGFTAALLRREHRRPPVLLPALEARSRNDRRPL